MHSNIICPLLIQLASNVLGSSCCHDLASCHRQLGNLEGIWQMMMRCKIAILFGLLLRLFPAANAIYEILRVVLKRR